MSCCAAPTPVHGTRVPGQCCSPAVARDGPALAAPTRRCPSSKEQPGKVTNVHHRWLEDGEMKLDFRLRRAWCTSNALRLLAMAGVEVQVDDIVAERGTLAEPHRQAVWHSRPARSGDGDDELNLRTVRAVGRALRIRRRAHAGLQERGICAGYDGRQLSREFVHELIPALGQDFWSAHSRHRPRRCSPSAPVATPGRAGPHGDRQPQLRGDNGIKVYWQGGA